MTTQVHATLADSDKPKSHTSEFNTVKEAIAIHLQTIHECSPSRYPVTVYVDGRVYVTIVPQVSGSIILVFWDGRIQTLPTKESCVGHQS